MTNLTSRLYSPLVSLTDGRVYHTVKLDIQGEQLMGMTLKQVEVIAIGMMNLNRVRCREGLVERGMPVTGMECEGSEEEK